MKYCRLLFTLIVAVLSVSFMPSGIKSAQASGSVTYTGTFTDGHQHDFYGFRSAEGGSVTITMQSTTGCGSPDTFVVVTGPNGFVQSGDDGFGCGLDTIFTVQIPFTGLYTVDATTFCQCSGDNGSYILTISGDIHIGSNMWFDPGDGRIDPRPNQRVAVWCNYMADTPNVVVYGIGDMKTNNSGGFYLATFNYADLVKAGRKGITKDGGKGNGTISMMTDGKGHFYTAWNGGSFNATGLGDFAKTFQCDFNAVKKATTK